MHLRPPPRLQPVSRRRRVDRGSGILLCGALAAAAGCGGESADPLTRPSPADVAGYEGPPFYAPPQPPASEPVMPGAAGNAADFVEDEVPGTVDFPEACVIRRGDEETVRQPVDIILLLDNSGSMDDELGAVEANINVNFAAILSRSNVDYRLILISRHRQEPRDESEEASTSICVTSPLSGLESCDDAEQPALTDQFFQYSTKLESDDSFDVALDTFAPPFEDSEREEKFDQAPNGWSEWLRPGAKKVFLEMTDDDEDMPIGEFVASLVSMAPEHFGRDPSAPSFVFHSIVGLAEKPDPTEPYLPDEPVQSERCEGNDNDVTSAGESYQELSRMTGGLRFPLCQFGAYDVVFETIADDVQRRTVACDFPIPPPPAGLELDLTKVAIEYAPGNGAEPANFGQAATVGDCQPNAFYIADDRLRLCPETCAAVTSDPQASVAALFTCQSQIIVPR